MFTVRVSIVTVLKSLWGSAATKSVTNQSEGAGCVVRRRLGVKKTEHFMRDAKTQGNIAGQNRFPLKSAFVQKVDINITAPPA